MGSRRLGRTEVGVSRRGSIFCLVQRVPVEYRHLETRKTVRISLRTGDRREAEKRGTRLKARIFGCWEAGCAAVGEDPEAERRALAAAAASEGFALRPMAEIAAGPVDDLLARVERLARSDPAARDPALANALLGAGPGAAKAAPGASPRLSEFLAAYEADTPDLRRGMNKDQVRRWQNPRKKVLADLVACIGDKPVLLVDREDALVYRRILADLITEDKLKPDTANKYLYYLNRMFNHYFVLKGAAQKSPFREMAYTGIGSGGARVPVSVPWIQKHLSCADPLPTLNEEARDILLVMVNTGARPSEICDLLPERIKLDHPIPHIQIRADNRRLKTANANRDIPLVGVSFEAMRRHPEGFLRYRGTASFSAIANKYLSSHCALTPEQTVYSLRHAFEDRMLAAGAVDRLAADLMGHSLQRPRYGDGASLEQKHELLLRMAL